MTDARSVNLVVNLPSDLADEIERVQHTDPEFIAKVLTYGLVRRAVFARLQGVTALHRPSSSDVDSALETSFELT
jgi:hypothetical protein